MAALVLQDAARAVFGYAYVFANPQKGSFPLLNLEDAKVMFFDEWRFDQSVLPFSTQCLLLDGSPVPVARPQNISGQTGHKLYVGRAPVFVTTKLEDMCRLE